MKNRLYQSIILIFMLVVSASAFAQTKLSSFTHKSFDNGFTLTITGKDIKSPRQSNAYAGKMLIFEFDGVLATPSKQVNVKRNNIDFYKFAQFTSKPPVVRLIVNCTTVLKPEIYQVDNGWSIVIGNAELPPIVPANATSLPKVKTEIEQQMKTELLPLEDAKSLVIEKTEIRSTAKADGFQPPEKKVEAPKVVNYTAPPVATSTNGMVRHLEFYNTEIALIVKALADQTGSNIVTAPNVQAQLSVSLRNVTVEQALDLITKLAGYRYAKMGNTYVVGTPDFLMRVLVHDPRAAGKTVTRVVPLVSRKAGEIKRAVIKALSLDPINETLRIVHPFEQHEPGDTGATNQPASGGASGRTGGSNPPAGQDGGLNVQSENTTNQQQSNGQQQSQGAGANTATVSSTMLGDADYLILIGESHRVEQANGLIVELDTALASIKGIPLEQASTVPVTMTYRVRGSKAEDLAAAVKEVAGDVVVAATPKTSRADQSVVLFGRAADVNRLIEMLERLDRVADGGELVYEVYEVRFADPRALKDRLLQTFDSLLVLTGAEDVSGLSYAPPGGTPTTGLTGSATGGSDTVSGIATTGTSIYNRLEPYALPMKLILSGSKSVVESALRMLSALDVPAKQLAVEARVVDMSKEDIIAAGVDWNIVSGGLVKLIRLNNSQPPGSDGSPFNKGTVGFGGTDATIDVTATLDKLIAKNNLIARPNLLVIDGREGVVFIGDKVRYIKSITSGQTGPSVEIGEEEVGVKLNVLPRIGADNTISIEVQPTVSFIRSFIPTGSGGEVPITAVRTTRTTLRINNGETIAIGGLISQEDRKTVSGIPVLMDIPLIGQLFRRTTNSKVQSEIVIFITVRVIEGPASAGRDASSTSSGGG